MESEQSADEVLAAVSRSLKSYPFDFQGAKIITGQEEGAYGWITINYLLGRFTQVSASYHGGRSVPLLSWALVSGSLARGMMDK